MQIRMYVRTYGTNKTCNKYAYNIYAHTSRTYNYTYMYECRLKLPTYIRTYVVQDKNRFEK